MDPPQILPGLTCQLEAFRPLIYPLGQCSDMNSKPDDFLYSLSQDGAGDAELRWADPDVSRVLD